MSLYQHKFLAKPGDDEEDDADEDWNEPHIDPDDES